MSTTPAEWAVVERQPSGAIVTRRAYRDAQGRWVRGDFAGTFASVPEAEEELGPPGSRRLSVAEAVAQTLEDGRRRDEAWRAERVPIVTAEQLIQDLRYAVVEAACAWRDAEDAWIGAAHRRDASASERRRSSIVARDELFAAVDALRKGSPS